MRWKATNVSGGRWHGSLKIVFMQQQIQLNHVIHFDLIQQKQSPINFASVLIAREFSPPSANRKIHVRHLSFLIINECIKCTSVGKLTDRTALFEWNFEELSRDNVINSITYHSDTVVSFTRHSCFSIFCFQKFTFSRNLVWH